MKARYLTGMGGSFEKVEGGFIARVLLKLQTSKKDKGQLKTACILSPKGDDDLELTPFSSYEAAEAAIKAYCSESRNWTINKICENCELDEGDFK